MTTPPSNLVLSFIIPALNEEARIGHSIGSIRDSIIEHEYEIIVSDNGSTDSTRTIAEALGAKVLYQPDITIAALRNEGARWSRGDILVFLDADITLGPGWETALTSFLNTQSTKKFITGSTCTSPDPNNFLSKYWFNLLKTTKSNYINSGHLLISRSLFQELDGFDNNLRTSEDVDLCARAELQGAKLVKNSDLIAHHHGYPAKFTEFILREAWHGQQDVRSIKSFLSSRSALAAASNSTLLTSSVLISVIFENALPLLIGLTLSQALCLTLTYKKFGNIEIKYNSNASLCFQAYLLGRTLSPILKITSPRKR